MTGLAQFLLICIIALLLAVGVQSYRLSAAARAADEARADVARLEAALTGYDAENARLAGQLEDQSAAVRAIADSAAAARQAYLLRTSANLRRALDAYARARAAGDEEADAMLAANIGPGCASAMAYLRHQAPRLGYERLVSERLLE